MNEIWKDIPGYKGYYQASNLGRIKSVDRIVTRDSYYIHKMNIKGEIRKPTNHPSGYLRIPLCKNGIVKLKYVHGLIMLSFVGVKPKGYDVDHIDKNRTNNNMTNLRYITIKENRGVIGNSHAKKKAVLQYDLKGKIINEFESGSEAYRITKINYRNISNACLGIVESAGGYIWKFKNK